MADLSTNYMDDILAESMNGKRKYRITRADGSFEEVTLEDISEYEQIGSVFGAGDINRTNQAVNEKFDSGDVVDPMETTVPGFAADALAVKNQFNEQNKKIVGSFEVKTVSVKTGSGDAIGNVELKHSYGNKALILLQSQRADIYLTHQDNVNGTIYAGAKWWNSDSWVENTTFNVTMVVIKLPQ